MFKTDAIVCRIPTEAAIKVDKLFCDVAYPVNSADSQTWATWASAIFTLGLLVFAVAAWKSSQAQIRHMKNESALAAKWNQEQMRHMKEESDKATERNQDQIIASENLEDRRNRETALFEYLGAHAEIFTAGSGNQEALRAAGAKLRKASLRFIILNAFPGRSGEITNLDDLSMKMAEAGTHTPNDGDLLYGRNSIFNGVHSILRDYHDGRLEGDQIRHEFHDLFVRTMKTYSEYLDPHYVELAERRGWLID